MTDEADDGAGDCGAGDCGAGDDGARANAPDGDGAAELVRAHVFVSGRVQGVTYRATTRREAGRHGVDGWVRNLADGRVEAVFEGPESAVEAMLDCCHEGPSRARVEGVEVEYEPPEGVDGFEVRR